LYDCDFNQQLELGLVHPQQRQTVFEIDSLEDLTGELSWQRLLMWQGQVVSSSGTAAVAAPLGSTPCGPCLFPPRRS